jgi:exonuclease SbcC
MIPQRLELKNFMAYREPDPLDLTGLHVVCLTGDNGAGKSTLLDAITWALWGQARAKRDDELFAQGAAEMRVALTFVEGKETYQVVRMRRLGKAAKGKPASSSGQLDFFIRDAAQNGWRQISEGKTSETQQKIERTLNLTYDTFINSAYLKQGRADEFTLKPPGQRKELLGEILSLNVWSEYEEKAKQHLIVIDRERFKLEADLRASEEELLRLPEYERALGDATAAISESESTLRSAETEQRNIDAQRERAQALRAQLSQCEARLRAIDAERDKIRSELEQHQHSLRSYQAAVAARVEIEQGYQALIDARALSDALTVKLTSMVELNARKTRAEGAIADARRAIESECDAALRVLESLESAANAADSRAKLAAITDKSNGLPALLARSTELTNARIGASERQGEAKAQNDQFKREMTEIKGRIDAMSSVGAICPTCGRALDEADRTRLLDELQTRGKERGNAYRANDALVKQLNDQRASLEAQIASVEGEIASIQMLQRDAGALQGRVAQAEQAERELPGARSRLMQARAALDGGDYAQEDHRALAQVQKELAALGYNQSEHIQVSERLKQLAAFTERKSELDHAELGIKSETRAMDALQVQLDAAHARASAESNESARLRAELTDLDALMQRAATVAQTLKTAQQAYFDARRRLDAAQQRVQACKSQEATAGRLRGEIDTLARRYALTEELRLAFSKNGVPAMIIESVLPELEATANALLSKMTNGKMTVRFETQRLTLRGDTTETLEIRISDELGERAYEMFSGGEAFRINFAVRIALSKLLARRAGARLRTMFIDEGFGTQDAMGRERLVEALKMIEDDFELIVIITHIEELKDAFPARIEVTKSAKGSQARIV